MKRTAFCICCPHLTHKKKNILMTMVSVLLVTNVFLMSWALNCEDKHTKLLETSIYAENVLRVNARTCLDQVNYLQKELEDIRKRQGVGNHLKDDSLFQFPDSLNHLKQNLQRHEWVHGNNNTNNKQVENSDGRNNNDNEIEALKNYFHSGSETEFPPGDADFSRFSSSALSTAGRVHGSRTVESGHGDRAHDLDEVVKKAAGELNLYNRNRPIREQKDGGAEMKQVRQDASFPFLYSTTNFVEGVFRLVGDVGIEYRLAFGNPSLTGSQDANRDKVGASSKKGHYSEAVVHMVRPLGSPVVVKADFSTQRETIHMILPLSGRVDTFKTFLDNLLVNIFPIDESWRLTVVYSGANGFSEAKRVFNAAIRSGRAPRRYFSWVNIGHEVKQEFSRGKALDFGARSVSASNAHEVSPLLFFVDVDTVFTTNFLARCRRHSVLGLSVYYPIVFSLYNPQLVYELSGKRIPKEVSQRARTSDPRAGFWREFGYGMTCQHQLDYFAAGGFDLKSEGWGGEDVALYRKHLAMNGKRLDSGKKDNLDGEIAVGPVVVRAPDPGIVHIWHEKACDSSTLSESRFKACLRSKTLTEGSQEQLGVLLFGNKTGRKGQSL